MLAIFPSLQPEELVYSAVSRYADIMAYPDTREALLQIFHYFPGDPDVDLPDGLEHLLDSLPPGHGLTWCRITVQYLVEVSEDQPAEAVACLASIDIVGRDDHWRTELWRADAKTIIRRALRSPDQPTQAAARELVNRWVALGGIDFRDLLDGPE